MRDGYRVLTVWFALAVLTIVSQDLYGRRSMAAPASPVHMVVTAEGRHGGEVPLVPAGEVRCKCTKAEKDSKWRIGFRSLANALDWSFSF
jgi:hypothetical protein